VDEDAWAKHLENLRLRRPFRRFIHPRTKSDGKVVWLSINGVPVFDESGKFVGYCGNGSDITSQIMMENELEVSRRALEERVTQLELTKAELEERGAKLAKLTRDLKEARDSAEKANRSKSQFLANMSHELRTPLNAILGFSEIIRDEALGPINSPKYAEYAGDIHYSGRHLLGLINDILDLSKIESGESKLDIETIDMAEVAGSAVLLVGHLAEKGGIGLITQLSPELPEIMADRRKIMQILVNLLSNAIKFTEQGGSVTFTAHCERKQLLIIRIIDTGIGMALEDIPKAMMQFGQVENSHSRKYEGTGLGLPLTKCLVELHGGTLELQSEKGRGTTATVLMPTNCVRQPSSLLDKLPTRALADIAR
jgi:signal transduction histidine kinase